MGFVNAAAGLDGDGDGDGDGDDKLPRFCSVVLGDVVVGVCFALSVPVGGVVAGVCFALSVLVGGVVAGVCFALSVLVGGVCFVLGALVGEVVPTAADPLLACGSAVPLGKAFCLGMVEP